MKNWLKGGLISALVVLAYSIWKLSGIISAAKAAGANMASIGWTSMLPGLIIIGVVAFVIGAVIGWLLEVLIKKYNMKNWLVVVIVLILLLIYAFVLRLVFGGLSA
jgi:hypothetical protein